MVFDDDSLRYGVLEIEKWAIDIRRVFHMYPELGFEEYRSRDSIIGYLKEMAIEHRIVAKTGVVGLIEGKGDGRTVALRADMDALPMKDRKEVPYRSRVDGKAHSCGHDAHMAILLGAARILNGLKDSIKGNIKLLFQPAEETQGGAKPMIEAGALEMPHVDGVFGLHVDNSLRRGKVGIRYGHMKAASDMINIRIHGESVHGAYPHKGIDAIAISNQVMTTLQTIVSRNVDPRTSAVLTIGTIKGGYARNVVADSVELEGIVRTLNDKTRDLVLHNIKRIVKDVSRSMGGKGEVVRIGGYPGLVNHDSMVDIVKRNATGLLGNKNVDEIPYPSFGVDDFSYFAKERPAAYFHLGSGNKDKGIIYDGHSPYFDIDEGCLACGILLQVKNALEFLHK